MGAVVSQFCASEKCGSIDVGCFECVLVELLTEVVPFNIDPALE